MGGKAVIIQSINLCLLLEPQVAFVDEQFIFLVVT
jgi:hypothetical protein